jgi:HK97 family phage major capsid protein
MSIALENAILNGTGTGQPTGILTGITWTTGSNRIDWGTGAVGYDNIVDGLALLPTMYHNTSVFVMSRKTLFGGIRKIKETTGAPIFTYNAQDAAAMRILGYPVIMDDYIPDDVILVGDLSYYYMNFSSPIELSSSREAGFKSGKITYRGLAVTDGKPALAEAFVKISKTGV